MSALPADILISPFIVAVDTREQNPFTFLDLKADARQKRRPLQIRCLRRTLQAGDYSLVGLEGEISIERKSLADCFSTLGQQRDRFERELGRLAAYRWAAVVVEADWPAILGEPPERSQLNPKTIHRSVIAWQMRFPNIHWWTCFSRRFAEITTYRLLERYWKDRCRSDKNRLADVPSGGVEPGSDFAPSST